LKTWSFLSTLMLLGLTACAVGPDYDRPSAPEPTNYKELKGWKVATPSDASDRGDWWSVFKDAKLDSLESQVDISNQTVAAAAAAYRLAQAAVKEAQAGLFPTVSVNYTGAGAHNGSASSGVTGSSSTLFTSSLTGNASWQLDIWGQVRRSVESNVAGAQVSAADLANAKLSSQSLLATAYFNLRAADSLKTLLDQTVVIFKRTLVITENQFKAGTASKADVATAQAQLFNTQASALNVGVARAQFEHAIAALIGKPPADLTIAPTSLPLVPPTIPVSVPSTLLERRPDIAAAERQMQQENALIGVAIAAYYPAVTLTASYGFAGLGPLAVSLANEVWTAGVSASQIVFDGGLRSAQVDAARATYDQAVANYRQTVLSAFQQVEDQLAAVRILAQEARVEDQAVTAAQEEVNILLNQYRAGTVAFTAVVVAQATLLADQETALTIRQSRFLATVILIEALGGGWDVKLLPASRELETANPLIPHF
jgi:NodT family efflux transporter outer membrane factor (OMF) lipoprotein